MAAALAGAFGAVNAVSLYVEHGRESFDAVHVEGAARLARHAREAGVERLVHVSGIGADPGSAAPYIRARGRGELAVTEAFGAATLIRPAVMFGPDDAFLTRLVKLVRTLPVYPMFGRGQTRLQPVYVTDVAEAIADEIFAGYEYLEDFRTEDELHAELVRTIEGLHDLNLQRADRVTMAHGLEARVPFLELDMISLGLSLPAGWKLAGEDQEEKRLLRQAFEGWLPDDFLWRKKAQFGDGSGAASVLKEIMEERVTEEEFERERHEVEPPLRTREEVAYYRIFAEDLGEVRPRRTIGRFATA